MSHQSYTQTRTEQHLQLWMYFLPVVGIVPALWTLYRASNLSNTENKVLSRVLLRQQKASRRAINLNLIWLSSYVLSSWGASTASEILSFRMLYANAIITTGYFLACTYLMYRSGKKNSFASWKNN